MNVHPAKRAVAAFVKAARQGAQHALRAGLELLRLLPEFDARGGDRRSAKAADQKPHVAVSDGGRSAWEKLNEDELGWSVDSAQRAMRAARGYLKFSEIAPETDWWTLPSKQKNALLKGIVPYTAGKTMKELCSAWDRLMAEGAGLQGGDHGSGNGLTTEFELRSRAIADRVWWQTRAREIMEGLDSRKWAQLAPEELAAVAVALEQAGRALKKQVKPGVEPAKEFLEPPVKRAKGRVIEAGQQALQAPADEKKGGQK